MILEEFVEGLKQKKKRKEKHMSLREYAAIHKKHIAYHKEKSPDLLYVVPMEEMAELTQHLTKIMRKKEPVKDNYGCLEELADVQICIDNLRLALDISDDDFRYAMEIKMERNKKRLKKGTI